LDNVRRKVPLVGDAEYPQTRPEAALAVVRRLASEFQGRSFDAEACAAALGYRSARNGAFRQILADLRKYGLITGRGDGIGATDLLRRLVVPLESEDRAAARLEMMNSVPLFRELFHRFAGRLPSDEGLTAALIQMTHADRLKVQGRVPKIRSLLAEGWGSHGPWERPSVAPTDPASSAAPSAPWPGPPPNARALRFDAGPVRLEFPFTPDGLRLLRSNLLDPALWSTLSGSVPEAGRADPEPEENRPPGSPPGRPGLRPAVP
jgi:hypothetical protein